MIIYPSKEQKKILLAIIVVLKLMEMDTQTIVQIVYMESMLTLAQEIEKIPAKVL